MVVGKTMLHRGFAEQHGSCNPRVTLKRNIHVELRW